MYNNMNYLEILSEKSKNLKDFAFKNKVDYRIAHPFPHIEIKDFFSNSFLNDVLSQFPDLSKYNKSQIYENKNEIKFANNDLEKYPEKIKIFFKLVFKNLISIKSFNLTFFADEFIFFLFTFTRSELIIFLMFDLVKWSIFFDKKMSSLVFLSLSTTKNFIELFII